MSGVIPARAQGNACEMRSFARICLTCVAVLWIAHFSSGPNDFILDDWTNLIHHADRDWSSITRNTFTHPTRPVSLFFVLGSFHLFGDNPGAFFLLSAAANAFTLTLLLRLGRVLGSSHRALLTAGLLFATWPTLAECTRWPTLIAGASACALPAYVGAMLHFVAYQRLGGRWRLATGAALHLVGAFCYEPGIFLPAACLLLVPVAGWRRTLAIGGTCGVVLVPYAVWRLTNALGMGTFMLAEQFKPDLSPAALLWNARENLSWWIGPRMWEHLHLPSLVDSPTHVAVLLAGWLLVAVRGRRCVANAPLVPEPGTLSPPARAAFWLAWFALASVPSLLSYAGGRLMFLPAMAAAFLLSALPEVMPGRAPTAAMRCLAVLFLTANLASHRDWITSGSVVRELRDRFRAEMPGWAPAGKTAVLVVTDGVQPAKGDAPGRAYDLGTAGFLRGFFLDNLYNGPGALPVYLDVECGLRRTEDGYAWHRRFRPTETLSASTKQVVVIPISPMLEARGWPCGPRPTSSPADRPR
jgi:hypothetical protein